MQSNECDDSSSDSIKKIKIKDEVAEIDADNEFEFSRDFISEYVPQSRLFSLLIKKPSLKEFEDDYTAPTLPINNNNIFKTKKWNILDKYFYLWVFQVLFTGYNRLFQPVDLYKLPPDLENDVMYTKFKQNWESALKTYGHSAKSKWLLIKALEKTFRTTLLYCISTYTVSNISQSVMPVVSKKLNIFVENRNNPNVPDPHIGTGIAHTIILALLMVIGIASFCQGYYTSNAIGVYLRSVLSRAILEKVMVLSDESESKISKNRVTTVGTTDLSRIEYGCSLIPYIFGFPVSLVIVVALLIKNVGPVTLVGCAYFLFSLLLSGWGFKKMFDLRIVSNKSTDARVSYIREAVSNLKMIKYFTYERAYEKIINEKRNSEIEIVKKMQYIQSIIQSHGLLAPILGSLFTFLIAFKINPNRSPSSVFAALALFNILSNQMLYVPNCIGTFINMFLSFNRIQEILLGKEGKPKMLELTDKRNAIELKNVSVSYGSRHILDNISLSILRKEFVTILGPTGSGKSTLLSTMTFDGFILCSTPWIQSTTIKLNILFGLPYVECIYKDVIYACALLPDLKAFTAGDRTELGEAGITLSGGQKARVALARACYKALYTQYTNSNSNIVILLDDVMSALDAKSGLHVLEEAILKLLKDCTVLLVTHQVNLVTKSDRVIYVKGDSTVKLDNLRELLQNNDFKQFYDSCSQENTHDEEDNENLDTAEKLHLKKIQTIMSQQYNDKDDLEKGRIVTEENRATNSFGLQVYVNFIKAAVGKHWATFLVFAFTIGCTTAFFSLFPSVWLSFWVEDKFGKPRSFYMGLYSLWAILFFVFISIELVTIATACITSSKNLHQKSLHNILYTPMSFLDVTPLGRIINRFTKDIDAMDNQMPYVAVFGVYLLFQICAVLIMCAIYIPWFLIAIPFLVLALMFIYSLYQCTGREIKRIEAVQRSLVFNNFNETLNGVETIKNYKVEKLFIRKHDILTDKNNQASFLYFCLQRWSSTWIVNLCAVFSIIISLLCIFKVFKVSASTVGLLLTYVIQLSLTLKALLFEISRIENYMNSVERLVEYANDLPQEKPYILPNSNVGNSWPKDGSLKFENCCMSYRPELPLALKNFSLAVNAGEKVGIVGRSGAGKSTLTSCIFRLTELNSGKISIDGVNIAEIGLLKLRENLAIIPQDPVLFKGTIRANLDPFGNFSDDYLWDVLGKSVYEYDEMLLAKKENNVDDKFHLDHMVEVNGSNYSNGERQMLALARVLIKQNLKILIMDEATSQVDLELDLKITNKIFKALKNSTIITIAHRLRSILKYDKILVMDNGEMKEYGKPLDLFMAEGSIFQELCAKSKIRRSEF